jgi:phosphatidylserine/phosphatidylglycerophosphate/cardiolipin synthase-like enzyme
LLATQFSQTASYQICFTPAEKCSSRITNYIHQAKKTIEVQAYSFTSRRISKALIKAQQRGVKVRVIIDKSELINYSRVWSLLKGKVPVWLDNKVRIAHNKVMIFDGDAVLTGSYNFTNAAEYKNAENSLYIYDALLAKAYLVNWQRRQKQSIRLNLKLANKWQQKLKAQHKGDD